MPMPPSRGGATSRPGGMGRRDVTDKNEKIQYYTQLSFDQGKNEYTMTKITFGTLVAILIFAAVVYFLNLGTNFLIFAGVLFAFWAFYFVTSLIKKNSLRLLPTKEAETYWTYELTQEYKQRNVVTNDFKKLVADRLVDRTTLIDDVSVELISYTPLIFEFSVQSSKARADYVLQEVGKWGSKFECNDGTVTQTGNVSYRVVYPRESMWKTLAGKSISPKDAIGETHEPSLEHNPIGLRTTSFEEITINNASLHTMVTGSSGYGKSNMFNMILYNMFHTNAVILFFDKKGGVEAMPTKDRCWAVTEDEQALAWIDAVSAEVRRRSDYLVENEKKKFASPEEAAKDSDAAPFTDEFPPVIIAVDECFQWVNGTGKVQQAMKKFLILVAQQGRFGGITLMVAAQSPKNSSIPDDVKGNVDQKIAFKQKADYESFAVDISKSPTDPKPSQIPAKEGGASGGVGQFCFSSGKTDGKPIPCKGYYISTKMITDGARRHSSKKYTKSAVLEAAQAAYAKAQAANPNLPPL